MWKLTSGYLVTWCKQWPPLHSILIILPVMFNVLGAAPYRLPEYGETPDNFTYYRGDRAILQCSVKFLGTKNVIWKKVNADHILTIGKMIYSGDKELSVDHISHRDEWNLVISDVQPRHAGLYECQISTKEDLRKYIQLNVKDEPAPRSEAIKISGPNYVEKGQRIKLTCNASGERGPPEDIDWFKNGLQIKQSQYRGISITKFRIAETRTLHSELEIEQSDMDDSGDYVCRSSELAITDKKVMVLNGKLNPKVFPRSQDTGNEKYAQGSTYVEGSAKRSRKKILNNGDYAETNHNKRDNNDPAAQKTSAASTVFVMNYSSRVMSHVLTFLCFIYLVPNALQRQ